VVLRLWRKHTKYR